MSTISGTPEAPRLLDYWLAPTGAGDPVACLATSFTFDSEFFETQCLARFLGLDSPRGDQGGPDLAFLLQREERLAEARVCAVVDRSARPGYRSLRWDVIPVGVRGGLMHAKASLLVWQDLVRFIVGSANLTPAGYRNQVEAVSVLDSFAGSLVPAPLLQELIQALRGVLALAKGAPDSPGPISHADGILTEAERRIEGHGLPQTLPRGAPRMSVATSLAGAQVLNGLVKVWTGGPPRHATVLSPFWDGSGPGGGAAVGLKGLLAHRGPVSVTYLAGIDPLNGSFRVPASFRDSSNQRLKAEIRAFSPPDSQRFPDRRLHAKVVLLESDSWTAALIGSSNFTEGGLGLARSPHIEINLAIGAEKSSTTARTLRALVPAGKVVATEAIFVEGEDEDEAPEDMLPWGFVDCLLEPGDPPFLHFLFEPKQLPPSWSIRLPTGRLLLDSNEWRRIGAPTDHITSADSGDETAWVVVKWRDTDGDHAATWVVNVTDPSSLPAPEILRNLPVALLLQALASSLPIYATIANYLKPRREDGQAGPVVDPLLRFNDPGNLLRRVRDFSMAMTGLKRRMQRPVASLPALEWRLCGPIGPLELANGIARESQKELIPGESAFLRAELVLTLRRVDWPAVLASLEERDEAGLRIDDLLIQIMAIQMPPVRDGALRAYIQSALGAAG